MTETFPQFEPWPKTYRLNRDVIVTEKIDGTNAAVQVHLAVGLGLPGNLDEGDTFHGFKVTSVDGRLYVVGAQSRKKLIAPQSDNYGFAGWVHENAQKLATALGEGTHFGEWYGAGIQRNLYNLDEKRFMLFNVTRWGAPEIREYLKGLFDGRVEVATVLYTGPFDVGTINSIVAELRENGSRHAPGTDYAEGVIVHHTQAGFNLKVTCEKDEQPKGVSHA
jgi:hypothetical protein